MEIKILNAEPEDYSRDALAVLSSVASVEEQRIPQSGLAAAVQGFEALIVRVGLDVNREVIESADRLKYILSATTGLDHIDIKAAEEKGIAIISLKGETDFLKTITSTAEYTWGLLLSLTRNIPAAFESVKQGEWDRQKFRGINLYGKNLGIAGLGRVGEQVAAYGRAFGMKVLAYDPYREGWPDGIERTLTPQQLLEASDILTLHMQYDSTTANFFSATLLEKVKRGAYVINTSRAGLWNEIAIFEMLASGHLAGAATDVMEYERDGSKRNGNPLLKYARNHTNLILTPHLAGATKESMERTELFIAQKWVQKIKDDE